MASLNIKHQAKQLRLQGKTYTEITKRIGVPKSTLSGWFRALKIPQKVEQNLMSKRQQSWRKTIVDFNKKRAVKIKQQHTSAQDHYALEVGKLSKRELKLVGVALYWAEGYKRGKDSVVFCNSDPAMIQLMMKFFRDVCNMQENKLKVQVHIHRNISVKKTTKFWSNITKVPICNFRKPLYQISKSSKNKRPKNRLLYGVCRIIIHDVSLVDRINGWINGLKI